MTDSIMTVISRKELAEIHKALSLTINERDAARAQLQEARDKLIEVRDTLHHTNNEFAVILRERNEARAEVERLRPAAEAWGAMEAKERAYGTWVLTGSAKDAQARDATVAEFKAARAAKEGG